LLACSATRSASVVAGSASPVSLMRASIWYSCSETVSTSPQRRSGLAANCISIAFRRAT